MAHRRAPQPNERQLAAIHRQRRINRLSLLSPEAQRELPQEDQRLLGLLPEGEEKPAMVAEPMKGADHG